MQQLTSYNSTERFSPWTFQLQFGGYLDLLIGSQKGL